MADQCVIVLHFCRSYAYLHSYYVRLVRIMSECSFAIHVQKQLAIPARNGRMDFPEFPVSRQLAPDPRGTLTHIHGGRAIQLAILAQFSFAMHGLHSSSIMWAGVGSNYE